jgi:hypothetical protein
MGDEWSTLHPGCFTHLLPTGQEAGCFSNKSNANRASQLIYHSLYYYCLQIYWFNYSIKLSTSTEQKDWTSKAILKVAASKGQLPGHTNTNTHTHKHTCTVHKHIHTSLNSIHATSVTDITSNQTEAVAWFEESQTSQEASHICAITPVCSADEVI